MFVVSTIEADIKVQPKDLTKPPQVAVTEVIEEQYIDKVIADLGLVVSIYDVQTIEGGHIYPNDGAAYFKARFRLAVFRPFVGEVIVGKLVSSSKDGVRVSLGFFQDILIPEYALQEPSFFNDAEGLWVWKYDGNDMFMDVGEQVRFRVKALKFTSPPSPAQLKASEDKLLGTSAKPFAPMEVIGEINDDGLGLTMWWATPADEDMAE